MRQSFFDYCRQYHKDALLREWDTAHNLPLTPQTVTYGSHKSAWSPCARHAPPGRATRPCVGFLL